MLLQMLSEQVTQGPKSAEVTQRVASDRSGNKIDLGGQSQGVIVDENNTPHVISEEHAKFLDCGHAITSLSEVLGKCAYGHITCHRHELHRCNKCGKILCDLEVVWEDDKPMCPDHGFPWGLILFALVMALGIVYLVER